jgi:hypothetical protein
VAAGASLETLANLQSVLDAMPATTGSLVGVSTNLYYQCVADAQAQGSSIQAAPFSEGISFFYHGQWITPT